MRFFLDGHLLELKNADRVAFTKQVNNIVSLSSRQASYTNTIAAPKTAANMRIMKFLGFAGSRSRMPYVKTTAMIQDENTGDWIVYKGWANVTETANDYKIYVYEGIIDFFKAIENKTLTEIGISELNHIKNIDTVVASFANDLPYMYIIADYNGKCLTSPIIEYPDDPTPDDDSDDPGEPVTVYAGGDLNIDYMVPSFRMSFVFQKIFEFAGFTFSGSMFATEKFLNWFVTFPKPVPVNTPVVNEITDQFSQIVETPTNFPVGGGTFLGSVFYALLTPSNFDTPEANNNSGYITIEQDGAYRLKVSGTLSTPNQTNGLINWVLRDSANLIKDQGQIDAAINAEIIIPALAGDRLGLSAQLTGSNSPAGYFPLTGQIQTVFDLILGYDANFEDALIDFDAKKIIDEVMQRFSLTMISDKYKNHIEFITLDEIVQNEDVEDWSNKFPLKTSEKYKIGNYAQRNNYIYKYNDSNDTHNDGFIPIDDKNLADEVTILSSAFYSPEKKKSTFLGNKWNVYKIWNKEVKDDGKVDYKELSGRFYSLRAESYTFPVAIKIASESLNTQATISTIQRENYYRMSLQEIVYDNYPSMQKVLNDVKFIEASFFLTSVDVERFDFKRLIYVAQFSSYYIVNRIVNFIKGKPTKCELIEVDYYVESDAPEVVQPGTFVEISDAIIDGCDVIVNFNTDAEYPLEIRIVAIRNTFGGTPGPDDILDYTVTINAPGPITITLPGPGFIWEIRFFLSEEVYSVPISINNLVECEPEPEPPTDCSPSGIVVTNVLRYNAGYPSPGDNGSLWNIYHTVQGIDLDANPPCVPYKLQLTVQSAAFGTQTKLTADIYFGYPAFMSFNLPGNPSTATITLSYISNAGEVVTSLPYSFP